MSRWREAFVNTATWPGKIFTGGHRLTDDAEVRLEASDAADAQLEEVLDGADAIHERRQIQDVFDVDATVDVADDGPTVGHDGDVGEAVQCGGLAVGCPRTSNENLNFIFSNALPK